MANFGKMAAVPTEQLKAWHFDEGLSLCEIGRRVGVGVSAVAQAMNVRGLKCRPRDDGRLKGKPKSEEMKARLRATKRKQWDDPAFHAAHIVNLEKGRAALRKNWRDPDLHAAYVAARWPSREA